MQVRVDEFRVALVLLVSFVTGRFLLLPAIRSARSGYVFIGFALGLGLFALIFFLALFITSYIRYKRDDDGE